jgi:hypothetical protein
MSGVIDLKRSCDGSRNDSASDDKRGRRKFHPKAGSASESTSDDTTTPAAAATTTVATGLYVGASLVMKRMASSQVAKWYEEGCLK